MKKSLFVFLTLGIALVIGGFQPAFAQEKETARAEFTLEEIVVTAQKREQQVQDVPIAITITTLEQMERQMVYTLQDLSRTTPALEFGDTGQGPGGAAIIRGIGTATFGGQTEPSVGVVVDGVYQGGSNVGNLFDVERVEVLRGPQGTLFGQSASAGVINIVTAAPDLSGFKARVGLDVTLDDKLGSKYGRQEVRAMVNVPVTETSAFRATVNANFHQGLRKNLKPGMDDQEDKNYDFRAKYLYAPTDDFSVNLIASYAKRDSTGPNLFAIRHIPTTDPRYAYLTGPQCGITSSEQNQEVCSTFDIKNKSERYDLSAQFDWVMANHDFVSITSYKRSNRLPSNEDIFGYDWAPFASMFEIRRWGTKGHSDTFSQELRVQSPADRKFNYLAGLYYNQVERQPDDRNDLGASQMWLPMPFLPPGGFPISKSTTYGTSENKNYAVFVDGSYPVTDKFTVLGGLRYSIYDIGVHNENVVTGDVRADSIEKDFLTWRAGVQYAANEDIMTYATVARSVKAPVVVPPLLTQPDGDSTLIAAEVPTSFEVGTKITAFEKKVALDFNLFYSKFVDYQGELCAEDPNSGALMCRPETIGETISQGLEIDIFGQPIPGLKINTGYIYADATYPDEPEWGYLAGEQLKGSPLHKFTFSGEYGKAVMETLYAFVAVDTTWKSEKRLNTDDHWSSVYPSCWVTGARIGISDINNKWSLTLFGRNLFEEPEGVSVFTMERSIVMGIPSENQWRQVGLSFNMNF